MTQAEINAKYTELCAQLGDATLKYEHVKSLVERIRNEIHALSQVKVTNEEAASNSPGE